MTQPIQEPSTDRSVSGLTWGQSQLARRPAAVVPTVVIQLKIVADDAVVAIGDGQFFLAVTEDMDGYLLSKVAAWLSTASSSGIPTVQLHNTRSGNDMLSTEITIDASELNSKTAATPAVIDAAQATVLWADEIRVDVDVAGTGAKGLGIDLTFALS